MAQWSSNTKSPPWSQAGAAGPGSGNRRKFPAHLLGTPGVDGALIPFQPRSWPDREQNRQDFLPLEC